LHLLLMMEYSNLYSTSRASCAYGDIITANTTSPSCCGHYGRRVIIRMVVTL
jgi:hypothetical protein